MTHTLAFLAGYTVASGMWIVVVLCVMGAEEHPDDRRRRREREKRDDTKEPNTELGRKIVAFRKRWQEDGIAPLSEKEIRERLRWRN